MEAPAHRFLRTHAISGRTSSRVVKRIRDSMLRQGWIGGPIAVLVADDKMYILDGHHRVYAARLAGIAVQYRKIHIESLRAFGYNSAQEVINAHAEAVFNRIIIR